MRRDSWSVVRGTETKWGRAVLWRCWTGQSFAVMVRGQNAPECATGPDLFVMQGDQGIDASGAAGGQQAGAQPHGDQEGRHRGERPGIRRGKAPNLARQESCEAVAGEEAEEDSCRKQARAFREDPIQNVSLLCSKGHADANL